MYNPNDERHVSRLREAMEWSGSKLKPFRDNHMKSLRQYVGSHYGEGGAGEKVPVNMLKLAVDVYQRQLSARPPRALVVSQDIKLRGQAYELEIATNHLIKEIDLGHTLRDAVKCALFSLGIVKVGITPSEMGEQAGFLHDAGQPYADVVLIEDWLHDMTARRMEEWDWCGNKYRLPYDAVMENPLFDQQAKANLQPSSRSDSTIGGGDESSNDLSAGRDVSRSEITDHVDLWDIWLPREGLIVTLPRDNGPPLRVIEWDGPERGPYHLLGFSSVPGNVMPAPPISHLIDMHDLVQRIWLQLGRQAERQKTLTLLSGPAATDGTGERILDAADGEGVRVDDPNSVKEHRLGGVDQVNMAYSIQLLDKFSYLAGNLDVLGGLSQQGSTATQEKLLKESSSSMVSDMQDTVVEFTKGIVEDLAFYRYTDPMLAQKFVKKLPNSDIEIPFTWGPERREEDFLAYNFDIEPYSMQARSPGERLQTLLQLVQQMILPMTPMMQQAGMQFNVADFMSLVSKYSDMPDLASLMTKAGFPITPDPSGNTSPEAPQPSTTRNYVRESVSNGGTQQSRDAELVKSLLGSGTPGGM